MTSLALTLLAFVLGMLLQLRVRSPLSNPTMIATLIMAAGLLLSGTGYAEYHEDVKPLSAFLTPAIVALSVPMYRLRSLLARQWMALVVGGLTGTLLAVAADMFTARALNLSVDAQRSLSTAPATSPVALQLAQFTHAPPALAATLAVLSGLLGALLLPPFLTLIGVKHPLARGIAIGSVAHGVGTAQARQEGEQTGAASSIGMGLAAVAVTLVVAFLSK